MTDEAGKTAYLCVGQGWQYSGVGNDLKNLDIAHEIFDKGTREIRGSGILPSRSKFDLGALCFDGTDRQLSVSEYTQAVTFAVSMAKYYEVREGGMSAPDFLAGHSVGEYGAACIANVISLEDAFPLVYSRGRLMRKSDNGIGGMLSVLGLNEGDVSALCRMLDLYIAVINTYDNMAVSGRMGDIKDLNKVLAPLKKRGVKKTVLRVPCATHSPLMAEAQDKLGEHFDSIKWRDADVPIVLGGGMITTSHREIREEMLGNLTSTFDWAGRVESMLKNGANDFIELWPKKKRFLLNFIKKIRYALRGEVSKNPKELLEARE